MTLNLTNINLKLKDFARIVSKFFLLIIAIDSQLK